MSLNKKLVEGLDYYWETKNGVKYRVFTEHYLKNRGFCCGNGCRHCPYRGGDKKIRTK